MNNHFAVAFASCLTQCQWTISEFAHFTGLAQSEVSRVLNGSRTATKGMLWRLLESNELPEREKLPLLIAFLKDLVPDRFAKQVTILRSKSEAAKAPQLDRVELACHHFREKAAASPAFRQWILDTHELFELGAQSDLPVGF